MKTRIKDCWNPASHHIATEVADVYPRIMKDGDMDAGAYSCGMVAGSIHDILTVKELIDHIISEAEGLIRERLAATLNDGRGRLLKRFKNVRPGVAVPARAPFITWRSYAIANS